MYQSPQAAGRGKIISRFSSKKRSLMGEKQATGNGSKRIPNQNLNTIKYGLSSVYQSKNLN